VTSVIPEDSLDHPLTRTSGPQVRYPVALKQAGTEGSAIVGVIVTPDGRVAAARVMASSHPEFGPAALVAVQGSQYEPPRREGQPVSVFSCQPVQFRLRYQR
jgi:TonB family protein